MDLSSQVTLVVLVPFVFLVIAQGKNVVGDSIGSNGPSQDAKIELLESTLRAISFALLNQNNKVFASLISTLKKDPYVSQLLSSKPLDGNSVDLNGFQGTPTTNLSVVPNETTAAISKTKWALKCSQPELFDINALDKRVTTDSSMTAILNQTENSVSIDWKPPKDCFRYISGLWFRVYQSGDPGASSDAHHAAVPFKCLKKGSNQSLSLNLFGINQLSGEKECLFYTGIPLKECHAYTIEVVPNYQSFRGKELKYEVVVPPSLVNLTNMEAITSVNIRSGSLVLHWLDNSGCSNKLEQISIRIFNDEITDNQTVPTLKVKRKCFDQTEKQSSDLFSLTLPNIDNRAEECAVDWKPLADCRKYTIEITSQYLSSWTGPPSVWTVFTSRERRGVRFASYFPRDFWSCENSDHFFCPSYGNCYDKRNFCNIYCPNMPEKPAFCANRRDCLVSELQCGDFCISPDMICDGKFDCIDGSDETNCDFCYESNALTGHIASENLDYSSLGSVHERRQQRLAGFTNVLVSVPENQTIWLSFAKYNNPQHGVKIYDGPFSTYPVLGSFPAGSSLPLPVRSSSNHLYLRYPNYLSNEPGVEAYYCSMDSQGRPFRPGCDGYINGNGVIRLTETKDAEPECLWYIDARTIHQTLLLKTSRKSLVNFGVIKPTWDTNSRLFGDWTRSRKLHLPQSWENKTAESAVAYTTGNKALLEFLLTNSSLPISYGYSLNFSIQVFSLSPTACTIDLAGSSGTIKSPLYPSAYPHLSDCRWRVVTPANTTIRLLFALFETEENKDFIYVYDGATLESPVSFEGSGTLATPFLVSSSSNEIIVRLVTDDEVAMSGFLAVYTAV